MQHEGARIRNENGAVTLCGYAALENVIGAELARGLKSNKPKSERCLGEDILTEASEPPVKLALPRLVVTVVKRKPPNGEDGDLPAEKWT
jgi:hypothetical protein